MSNRVLTFILSYVKPFLFDIYKNIYDFVGNALLQKKAPLVSEPPTSICLIALHQIGDIILCLPTINAITEACPQATTRMIVNDACIPLLKLAFPQIEFIPFKAVWQRAVRDLAHIDKNDDQLIEAKNQLKQILTQLKPEVAIIFHPDLRVNQLIGQTDIPHTFGFSDDGGGFHLSHKIKTPRSHHQSERVFALAKVFCKVFSLPQPHWQTPLLNIDNDALSRIKEILKAKHVPVDKVIVLHPFSSAPTKNWRDEKWHKVMEWIKMHNYTPVIVGGPHDHFDVSDVISLAGMLSLSETAALLSIARAFVGIDSGPGHLAASVGCLVVSIFSSVNEPERWQPIGEKVIVLHKPVKDRLAYPLHRRDLPTGTIGNPYIDQINATDVIDELDQILT